MTKLAIIHGPDQSIDVNAMILDNANSFSPFGKTKGQFKAELLESKLNISKRIYPQSMIIKDSENMIRKAVKNIHDVHFTGLLNDNQIAVAKELDNMRRSTKPAVLIKRSSRTGIGEVVNLQARLAQAFGSKKKVTADELNEYLTYILSQPNSIGFSQFVKNMLSSKFVDFNLPYSNKVGGTERSTNAKYWTREAFALIKLWALINSKKYQESNLHNLYVFNNDESTARLTFKTINHKTQNQKIARLAKMDADTLAAINDVNIIDKHGKEPGQFIDELRQGALTDYPRVGAIPFEQIKGILVAIGTATAAAAALISAIKKDVNDDVNLLIDKYGTEENAPNLNDFPGDPNNPAQKQSSGKSILPLLGAGLLLLNS